MGSKSYGDIRNFFFKYRSYTPIPLALIILYFSQPKLPYYWIGFVLLLTGEALRFASVRYAGGATRTTNVGAPFLCTAGPYAYVRNPLYIGNLLMYSGIVYIAGSSNIWAMLAITWIFFIVQYSLIVSLEEETLTNLFGEPYLDYCRNVPALWPRFSAWSNNDDRIPQTFLETLKTEKRTLQNVLLILLLILIRAQFS